MVQQARILKGMLLVLILLGLSSIWAESEDIPVEKFFKGPEISRFRISPDGEFVSALGPWKEGLNLFVIDLETRKKTRVTAIADQTINNYLWANDERLLFTMDHDGNESWGLFAVNRDGTKPRTLVPPFRSKGNFVFRYTRPLHVLPDRPEEILVISNRERAKFPDLYRMNIYNGGTRLVERNPGSFTGWRADHEGEVRLGEARDDDGSVTYFFREKGSEKWERIAHFAFGEPKWRPVGPPAHDRILPLNPPPVPFSYDGDLIYVASDIGRGASAIFEYDPGSRTMGRLLFGVDGHDVYNLVQSDFLRRPIGVYYETEKPRAHWFDEEKRMIQSYLEAKFPGLHSVVVTANRDHSKLIVASYSDRHPVVYSMLTIRKGELELEVLARNKGIELGLLAPQRPIEFTARDGLVLHGYLTIPTKRLVPHPLIVYPHGGPWVRDSWGYDPVVQFLASRGFAVFQINFRSSNGYGRDFLHAGDKQWGTTMQNDIIDGVKWAIGEGYADWERIGIMGSSYGGYAVLAQLVLHPEVYRFGISIAAPGNLVELINWRRKWKQEAVYTYYTKTIGDPKTERSLLERYSPVNFVQRIQAPVFIIHGSQDPRVPIEQPMQFRRELKRAGKEFRWLVKKDEGHGFRKTKNRVELFREIDKFLQPFRRP